MWSPPCSPGVGGLGLFTMEGMFRCLFGKISPSIIVIGGYARGIAAHRGRQWLSIRLISGLKLCAYVECIDGQWIASKTPRAI